MHRPQLIYLSHTYPNYSTTFTQDEVDLLRQSELDVHVYSLRRPPDRYLTSELLGELQRTQYIRPVRPWAAICAHARLIRRVPRKYCKVLFAVLRANLSSSLQGLKSLLHFFEAVHLGRLLSDRRADLVHVQFADTAATYAAVIHDLYGLPYTLAIHAHDIFEARYTPRLSRFRAWNAQRIRVISAFNKKWLEERVGIPPNKVEIIPCGVSARKFESRSRTASAPPTILAIGRLVDYKGFIYLIRACRMLSDAGHAFQCKIAGSGPEHGNLKKAIDDLGLSSEVELIGVVPHGSIRQHHEQSAVFVLPCCQGADGSMDGIPVALMEAMAMEMAVVSTEISGIPELIENEVSGLLVPPEDSTALAKAIALLLEDRELALRLGQNARRKVLAQFDLERNVERLISMLLREAHTKSINLTGEPCERKPLSTH